MSTEEKDSLEIRKLSLEIAELKRPWWERPSYILAALPTLLAIAALSVGFINGFFSAELTKLENQRHDLEAQVKEFEAKRDDLHRQYEQAKTDLEKITETGRNLRDEAAYLRYRAAKCEFEMKALNSRRK